MESLKSLFLSGERWPDYGQRDWDADDEKIQSPPTTHFVATVNDLTDMLDFDSEDIGGMDDDAGDDQEPVPTEHWKPTSTHDIYMVDTPKGMIMRSNGTRRRIIPPKNNQDGDASAAPSPAPITTSPIMTQP